MNDPHVESLSYHFISQQPNDLFDEAKPLTSALGSFKVELQDGKLTVWPQEHFADVENAKQAFEPFLHSWESVAFLDQKRSRIRFKFDQAHMIDRRPTPPQQGVVTGQVSIFLAGASLTATGTVTSIRKNREYPSPDPSFRASLLTDELIEHIELYQDGRAQLTPMAYWVLTRLEKECGDRKRVSAKMNISQKVLDTLGKLSSSTDPKRGRKAKGHGPTHLTSADLQWMEDVVLRITRRVGEVNAGSRSLPKITMGDFLHLD